MKTTAILISFITFTCFVSCNQEEEYDAVCRLIYSEQSTTRPQNEALRIATDAICLLEKNSSTTRSTNYRRVVGNAESPIVVTRKKTRSNDEQCASDTLLYIFNFEDEKGFAIISANIFAEPLLAVTDSGSINNINDIENPGLAIFVSAAEHYVQRVKDVRVPVLPPQQHLLIDDTLESSTIYPKLEVAWAYSSSESRYIYPETASHCTIVAILQSMTYFNYPNQIELTYKDDEMSTLNLPIMQWMNIKRHQGGICNYCSEYRHKIIGRLSREIHDRLGSAFCQNHDSTDYSTSYIYTHIGPDDARNTFTDFGFCVSNLGYYEPSCFAHSLTNNNLILVTGGKERNTVDHIWIVDGCIYSKVNHQEFVGDGVTFRLIDSVIETKCLNHFNWGWGGQGNGFFYDGVFDPLGRHSCYDYTIDTSALTDSDYKYNVRYFNVSL